MERLALIALGGALGALLRHGCTLAGARWTAAGVPLAVLAVNVVGSFAAGWLMTSLVRVSAHGEFGTSASGGENVRAFAMVGVLGAFTTFSAFSYENVELLREGLVLRAALHAVLHVALSIGAAALGAWCAR
jgi:CrcB protein